MSPSVKLYLKTFLFMGIAYGVTMMIFGSGIGEENVLWTFLFNVVCFGGYYPI